MSGRNYCFFFFSSRRRHTRSLCDWSSDVCSSDLGINIFTTPSADTQLIKPASIIQLMHVGKSGYRPTATWLMSNNTIGVCRLFTDTQSRPIWTMFGDEFRETLFGRPIIEMPDMVNPTTPPL